MKLTRELLERGRTVRGGFTRAQVQLLGLEWPPWRGWLKKLEGTELPDDIYRRFLELSGRDGTKLRKRKRGKCLNLGPLQADSRQLAVRIANVIRTRLDWLDQAEVDASPGAINSPAGMSEWVTQAAALIEPVLKNA